MQILFTEQTFRVSAVAELTLSHARLTCQLLLSMHPHCERPLLQTERPAEILERPLWAGLGDGRIMDAHFRWNSAEALEAAGLSE
jgi:hypothetical protein